LRREMKKYDRGVWETGKKRTREKACIGIKRKVNREKKPLKRISPRGEKSIRLKKPILYPMRGAAGERKKYRCSL